MPAILMTGAAGRIGTMLRPRLARPGRTLRLLDIAPLTARPGDPVFRYLGGELTFPAGDVPIP